MRVCRTPSLFIWKKSEMNNLLYGCFDSFQTVAFTYRISRRTMVHYNFLSVNTKPTGWTDKKFSSPSARFARQLERQADY